MEAPAEQFTDATSYTFDDVKDRPANKRNSLAALKDIVAGRKDWWEKKANKTGAAGSSRGSKVVQSMALPNMAAAGQGTGQGRSAQGLLFSLAPQDSTSPVAAGNSTTSNASLAAAVHQSLPQLRPADIKLQAEASSTPGRSPSSASSLKRMFSRLTGRSPKTAASVGSPSPSPHSPAGSLAAAASLSPTSDGTKPAAFGSPAASAPDADDTANQRLDQAVSEIPPTTGAATAAHTPRLAPAGPSSATPADSADAVSQEQAYSANEDFSPSANKTVSIAGHVADCSPGEVQSALKISAARDFIGPDDMGEADEEADGAGIACRLEEAMAEDVDLSLPCRTAAQPLIATDGDASMGEELGGADRGKQEVTGHMVGSGEAAEVALPGVEVRAVSTAAVEVGGVDVQESVGDETANAAIVRQVQEFSAHEAQPAQEPCEQVQVTQQAVDESAIDMPVSPAPALLQASVGYDPVPSPMLMSPMPMSFDCDAAMSPIVHEYGMNDAAAGYGIGGVQAEEGGDPEGRVHGSMPLPQEGLAAFGAEEAKADAAAGIRVPACLEVELSQGHDEDDDADAMMMDAAPCHPEPADEVCMPGPAAGAESGELGAGEQVSLPAVSDSRVEDAAGQAVGDGQEQLMASCVLKGHKVSPGLEEQVAAAGAMHPSEAGEEGHQEELQDMTMEVDEGLPIPETLPAEAEEPAEADSQPPALPVVGESQGTIMGGEHVFLQPEVSEVETAWQGCAPVTAADVAGAEAEGDGAGGQPAAGDLAEGLLALDDGSVGRVATESEVPVAAELEQGGHGAIECLMEVDDHDGSMPAELPLPQAMAPEGIMSADVAGGVWGAVTEAEAAGVVVAVQDNVAGSAGMDEVSGVGADCAAKQVLSKESTCQVQSVELEGFGSEGLAQQRAACAADTTAPIAPQVEAEGAIIVAQAGTVLEVEGGLDIAAADTASGAEGAVDVGSNGGAMGEEEDGVSAEALASMAALEAWMNGSGADGPGAEEGQAQGLGQEAELEHDPAHALTHGLSQVPELPDTTCASEAAGEPSEPLPMDGQQAGVYAQDAGTENSDEPVSPKAPTPMATDSPAAMPRAGTPADIWAAASPAATLRGPASPLTFSPLDLMNMDEGGLSPAFGFTFDGPSSEMPPLEATPSPVAKKLAGSASHVPFAQAVRDSIPLFGDRQSICIGDSMALDRLSLDDIAPFSRKKAQQHPTMDTLLEQPGDFSSSPCKEPPGTLAHEPPSSDSPTLLSNPMPASPPFIVAPAAAPVVSAAHPAATPAPPAFQTPVGRAPASGAASGRIGGGNANLRGAAVTPSANGSVSVSARSRAGGVYAPSAGATGSAGGAAQATPITGTAHASGSVSARSRGVYGGGASSGYGGAAFSGGGAAVGSAAKTARGSSGGGAALKAGADAASTPLTQQGAQRKTAAGSLKKPSPATVRTASDSGAPTHQRPGAHAIVSKPVRPASPQFAPSSPATTSTQQHAATPPLPATTTAQAAASAGLLEALAMTPPPATAAPPAPAPVAGSPAFTGAAPLPLMPTSWATPLAQMAALPMDAALHAPLLDHSPFLEDWASGSLRESSNIAEEARKLFSSLATSEPAGGAAPPAGAASAALLASMLRTPPPPPIVPPGAAAHRGPPPPSPSTVQMLEMQMSLMVQKLVDAESRLALLDKENEGLRDQLATVQFQSGITSGGADEMERQARQCAEEQLAAVTARLTVAEEAAAAGRREAEAARERSEEVAWQLEQQRSVHSGEVEGLRAQLNEAAHERDAACAQVESLQAQLSSKCSECDAFQAALQAEQRRVDELQQAYKAKDGELSQMQKSSAETSAKLQKALESLTAAQVNQRRTAAESEGKTAALSAAMARMQEDRNALSQELAATTGRAKEAEGQVAQMKQELARAAAENKELLAICNQLLSQVEKGNNKA